MNFIEELYYGNIKLGFRLVVQMICDSLICDDSIFKDL